jgi:hypothetical protein
VTNRGGSAKEEREDCGVTLLDGFGLQWYRSFHGGMQLLAPMEQVTLIAGQNNAGKSNIIRFAQQVLGSVRSHSGLIAPLPELDGLDTPQGLTDVRGVELAIAYGTVEDVISALQHTAPNPRLTSQDVKQLVQQVFSASAFQLLPDTELIWFRFVQGEPARRETGAVRLELSKAQLGAFTNSAEGRTASPLIRNASQVLTGQTSSTEQDLTRIIQKLEPFKVVPPVEVVEAFRQVRSAADGRGGGPVHSGHDLIARLAELQDPDVQALDDRTRFEAINRFVRTVLDDGSASLSIPHHRRAIYVRQEGVTLPLANLGTGVEQVIILAAAATLLQETLVCIEEPEIHLHPLLQRKLLQYLASETSNQYLIATHSAQMLDAELASIFHVTRAGQGTQIMHAARPSERAAICADLGYRPSDLVQANAVIWVEGPSDRIYIRHWLSLIDPALIEGIHYSLMFYGGRLLNHLSADDPDVREFISLRRLNRHIAIVIDSDKTSPRKPIGATKGRVRDEFNKGPGFAWITHGYTIENYVPADLLSAAIKSCHPRARFTWAGEPFANPLAEPSFKGKPSRADKIAISREVVRLWDQTTGWPLDLDRQVQRCADFIRQANGYATPARNASARRDRQP